MRKLQFLRQKLSFIVLPEDPQKEVMRFSVPKIVLSLVLCVTLVTIATTTYLSISFFKEKEALLLSKEQLTEQLHQEVSKTEKLHNLVKNYESRELKIHEQLDSLYELESQVKETMKDLPTSVNPSGGIDQVISDYEAKMLQEESSSLSGKISDLTKRYRNTLNIIQKTKHELQFIPTEWPVHKNKITSKFGLRVDPFKNITSFHTGVDIRGNTGDPVFSAADGQVTKAEYFGGFGNLIIIKHSEEHETLYAHLARIDVKAGDYVKKGEKIGAVGSTGRSTGPHLHYEIFENGSPIDPYTYLSIFDQYNKGE